jgi:hypothetical protein
MSCLSSHQCSSPVSIMESSASSTAESNSNVEKVCGWMHQTLFIEMRALLQSSMRSDFKWTNPFGEKLARRLAML